MVCIDYLGHDVPFWNRMSNVYLKFENLEIRKNLKTKWLTNLTTSEVVRFSRKNVQFSVNHVLMIFSEIAHKCNSLNDLLILNRTYGIWSDSHKTT